MRGPEAVEEVEERHATLERRRVGDRGEILSGLDIGRAEDRPARLPHGHHIALVAEDRKRMGRQRPGGDVDHRWGELAGDLVHVGDHQKETLRRRERGAQSATLQRTVECTRGATLALHLGHLRDRAP